jgi:hypothetical protein
MTEREHEQENGEELIDEQGRNQTQQSIDEDGAEASWDETNDEPAQGEGGQEIV